MEKKGAKETVGRIMNVIGEPIDEKFNLCAKNLMQKQTFEEQKCQNYILNF